jgi:hypothetical protein
MLQVTEATHAMAGVPVADSDVQVEAGDWDNVQVAMSKDQTQQYVTLYRALQFFDDRAAQPRITCPRLCVVGSSDNIQYGDRWRNALVSIGAAVERNKHYLEQLGWTVHLLADLDHMQAMQANRILPAVEPWLSEQLRK